MSLGDFGYFWSEQEDLDFLLTDEGTHLIERDVYFMTTVNVPTYYDVDQYTSLNQTVVVKNPCADRAFVNMTQDAGYTVPRDHEYIVTQPARQILYIDWTP